MPGIVKQFVDFTGNVNDTGENNMASIQPIADGNPANAANLSRPDEILRQRTEAVRNVEVDSLYLRDADRTLIIAGPGKVTWPGSTTVAATGIPVLSDTLYLLPMLTPGFAQTAPVPPVASAFGTLHLKRASDSLNSILVTSKRRSYAAGDRINITVSAGGAFSCVLDTENGYQRTVRIVATGSTQLTTVVNALAALTPSAPDNTALLLAALEGGAAGTDLLLTTQAQQYISGNYDGEGHAITPANLASFFTSNPTQALAEGDTLCVQFAQLADTASTGGRRQAVPENTNTAIAAGAFFNSRVHPENLVNALPICKVVNGSLVFGTGTAAAAGAVAFDLNGANASAIVYAGGGAWADGTTNPTTTVEAQLDKIVTDLAGAAGTGKILGSAVGGDLAAETLALQITDLVNNWFKNTRTGQTITGANTFNAQQTLNGASDTAFPWGTDTPPNNGTGRPKPIWYSVLDTGAGIKLRYYATKKGGMMVTVNALVTGMSGANVTYARDAAAWTDTSGATAARFTMAANGTWLYQFFNAVAASTWDDTNWTTYVQTDSVGLLTASLFFTTDATRTLTPYLSYDLLGTLFGTVHGYSRDGWAFAADVRPVYYVIDNIQVGDLITGYSMSLHKGSAITNTVTACLMHTTYTGDLLDGAGSSNGSGAGLYLLAETNLSITPAAGVPYYLRITPSGVTGDAIDEVCIKYHRPHP